MPESLVWNKYHKEAGIESSITAIIGHQSVWLLYGICSHFPTHIHCSETGASKRTEMIPKESFCTRWRVDGSCVMNSTCGDACSLVCALNCTVG